ncbi:hypothetical protein F5880DRAFT_923714 [Lentinula raphanica]|nr:hypothetical protein F5880DRAFT_923714 [Lentinula raphanica]
MCLDTFNLHRRIAELPIYYLKRRSRLLSPSGFRGKRLAVSGHRLIKTLKFKSQGSYSENRQVIFEYERVMSLSTHAFTEFTQQIARTTIYLDVLRSRTVKHFLLYCPTWCVQKRTISPTTKNSNATNHCTIYPPTRNSWRPTLILPDYEEIQEVLRTNETISPTTRSSNAPNHDTIQPPTRICTNNTSGSREGSRRSSVKRLKRFHPQPKI